MTVKVVTQQLKVEPRKAEQNTAYMSKDETKKEVEHLELLGYREAGDFYVEEVYDVTLSYCVDVRTRMTFSELERDDFMPDFNKDGDSEFIRITSKDIIGYMITDDDGLAFNTKTHKPSNIPHQCQVCGISVVLSGTDDLRLKFDHKDGYNLKCFKHRRPNLRGVGDRPDDHKLDEYNQKGDI